MTTPTAIEAPNPLAPGAWSAGARRFGWALFAGWIVLLGAVVFVGERSSSLADLEDAVASGEVTSVEVYGGMPEGARGYARVDLHWRDGPFAYYVELGEAKPRRSGPRGDERLPLVRPGVVDRLVASNEDLDVERRSDPGPPFSASFLAWQLPWPLALGGPLLVLATLGLLIVGPQPWRATRWAWFWIQGIAAPLGMLAYLVLGGPTGLSRPPQPGTRRLTGGWAFLLTFVVSSALASIAVGW
ncbi:hypothetical protein [Nocardioides pelophilus]|uniref:hypothetical protein n=1 Tax=Nocardioides pelophilus TaxID=2172019 RepID=UPI0015FFBF08|nr:hypothetical protein [Nocardioides pelophilus]